MTDAAPKAKRQRRTQAERTSDTKAKIMDAMVSRIVAQGYPTTTVEIVAKAAGISRGAIQHHYKDRADLFRGMIAYIASEMQIPLVPDAVAHKSLDEKVSYIVNRYWDVFQTDAVFALLDVSISSRGEEEVRRDLRDYFKSIQQSRSAAFRDMFRGEDLSDEVLEETRSLIEAAIRGHLVAGIMRGTPRERPEKELKVLANMASQLLHR
jgi:AcrR family transcriptional regulator